MRINKKNLEKQNYVRNIWIRMDDIIRIFRRSVNFCNSINKNTHNVHHRIVGNRVLSCGP